MQRYTIHEREVKVVNLPGRDHKMIIGPRNFGNAKNMCFGIADFPPNTHAPRHVHPSQEEIIYILTGKGKMYFNDRPEVIESGICVYIPPGIRHSINNTSDEVMRLVYVFSPPVEQGSYEEK